MSSNKPQAEAALFVAFNALLIRDLHVYFRSRGTWLNPLVFVLMVITLFTLGIGPDPSALSNHASGIIWVVALLGIMLSLDALFRADFDDGSLEQLLLSPQPLYLAVLAKVLAHWFITGLPIVLASPLYSLMLGIPADVIPVLALGLLVGSGILSFIGAIGASLTVSLRSGGLLIALLTLPLYVPAIIFGSQFVQSAIEGWPLMPTFSMLLGLLIGAIVLAPIAIIGGLRLSQDT
ncbi:MAG: heme exporter protein CcmB [Cellvibrionales bacterium]|jgi:heme exporter protein B|nr:heme exporter protein CcmB [Cellvibrionales bacterium]MBT6578855.1 heme exporter protein CcmB [Cellvibrionales bacterium]